ncbi:PAS/PAC domain protein [Laribacter hongkongensis HLHK9]|uniref:PAS/PAC domain protein n=1 Tax=Laribacter hongkongensis (strain HLHK9) TaxID=557598 RepID=C1DB84_LARHH|nr:DAHL domain-containing protein [Laribacter hongkongensis]ACO75423.1 PAS/PAC domain protein [Laribacter hongkongensis HLHK9]
MSGLVAALVAGLAGLGSIYLHTERVSPESHLLYTQHLRGLRETDALIDAELLANRLELSRNYDELTHQTAKAQADARHVGTPPDYLSAADTLSLRDDARALLATVMAKSELIDRFKREDSVARNSLAYFPVAASRLIDQPQPDSGQAGHGLISRYIRLVLAFSRQPDERHAEELTAMRAELGRMQLPASMQGRLDNLLLHGDKIMEVLPRLDRLTKEILALPTRGQLEHLNRNYGTAYSNALVLAGHFRNLLYTLSILLALFLAWTFASLLRTQRSLRKTHVELSQRLVAQSAAEKQLKLHATAFRNAHDGITLTDARGNILDVNPAFSRITGWERSEVIGRNPRVLKSGRHDAAFYEST